MIIVDDFMFLCTDDSITVTIYSCSKSENVYKGSIEDMPDEYRYAEVLSWDTPEHAWEITLNIEGKQDGE